LARELFDPVDSIFEVALVCVKPFEFTELALHPTVNCSETLFGVRTQAPDLGTQARNLSTQTSHIFGKALQRFFMTLQNFAMALQHFAMALQHFAMALQHFAMALQRFYYLRQLGLHSFPHRLSLAESLIDLGVECDKARIY
jgi:hypothetical protein